MSKEFRTFNAHRKQEIASALQSLNANRNPAMDDCRHGDPSWEKVLADPTYRKIIARHKEAMAALPADLRYDEKVRQPASLRWLHREIRVECAYGADRTAPWLRADTPERFCVWLKRYAETLLFMASDGDNANDSILQQSFAKAVDLARSMNLPPPPKPPSAPVAVSHGNYYLLELNAWAQANAKQPDSQAVKPDPGKAIAKGIAAYNRAKELQRTEGQAASEKAMGDFKRDWMNNPDPKVALHFQVYFQLMLHPLRELAGLNVGEQEQRTKRFSEYLREATRRNIANLPQWPEEPFADVNKADAAHQKLLSAIRASIEGESPAGQAKQPIPPGVQAVTPDPVAVAITMKARDPKLTVRKAAEAVGMHYSTLQKDPQWITTVDRLKQVGVGKVRRGSKSKEGQVEAVDE